MRCIKKHTVAYHKNIITAKIRISKAPNGRHISLAVAVGNINVVVGTKNRSLGTYNNKSTDVNFILKNLTA